MRAEYGLARVAAVVWWSGMNINACDQLVPSIINFTCEQTSACVNVQMLDMQYVLCLCYHFWFALIHTDMSGTLLYLT